MRITAAWLLILFLAPVCAAKADDVASLIVAEDKGPAAIPPSAIPFRGDDDERFAEDLIQRAEGADRTTALLPRLEALERIVRKLGKEVPPAQIEKLSIAHLESLSRHWRFYDGQFEAWHGDLQRATSALSKDAETLSRHRADWQRTLAAAEDNELTPALRNQVTTVMARLEAARQAVSEPIGKQIALNRRANALKADIDKHQLAVSAAISDIDTRLFKLDSPPMWRTEESPSGRDSAESFRAGLAMESEFLSEYSAAHADTSRAALGLSLALLAFLVWQAFRSRQQLPERAGANEALRVLQRPFSAWLLLVMSSTLILETDAPILKHQLVLFLALIPVLRLLPPSVYALLGPWPYLISALYLINLGSLLLLATPVYYRVYLLCVELLAVLLISWRLISTRRLNAAPNPLLARVIRDAGWIAAALFAVAATANALGNLSLAVMLTDGLLLSAYVGLVIYAAANLFESLLKLLTQHAASSRFRLVAENVHPLFRFFRRLIRIAAALGWLFVALEQFRLVRPLYDAVSAMLLYPISVGEISITPGNVVVFFLSVLLALWLARTTRSVLRDEVFRSVPVSRGIASSVSSLTYYAILLLGLLIALAAAGFKVSQLTIVLGALGVGIGLGLQNVVNNFVSGLILMFERPLQPGDVVEISGATGRVREIGMRSTTLKTFDGADVVVPNGSLLSEKLVNWTLQDLTRRIEIDIGVAYGSDPEQVLALMMDVVRATPGIIDEPAPAVLFSGFGASSLDFSIRAWTNNFGEWVNIRSDMNLRLYRALTDANIEIPFPQQDLHLRSVSAEAGAQLRGAPRSERPADPGSN